MDEVLSDRYEGNEFYSAAGLSTEQISNKVCLVALTGDWSALTSSLLTALGQNQVEPTFGRLFPTSRIVLLSIAISPFFTSSLSEKSFPFKGLSP